ncbi:hypothetical protein K7I13_00140 [Brucepastera parasyntrophica]|uniref:hypothetical protein n=1 Tax=Brucepastera parasyntrophica TaxID=2880008 RepID=UPI002109EC5F|nr:hypothetical protein [Brucepastera parasyntrophica]ULQ59812.1 hypothetical protein K7I13_00140 [Brucepastera parasyntrophica]
MAIQPIDLQTLYTQLDKVGKTQVQQQAAAEVDRDAKMAANRADAEKKTKTVQKTEAEEDGAAVVHEKKDFEEEQNSPQMKKQEKKEDSGEAPEEKKQEVIRDPDIGNRVDISG